MRSLLITATVVLVAAAAGIGVLAVAPAPEAPDSMTLVIETGSIATTTASKRGVGETPTGALGASPSRTDEGKREQTLDDVIAARLQRAKRDAADDGTASAGAPEQAESAVGQPAGSTAPGLAGAPNTPEPDSAAAEQPEAPSGAISITQMLAAQLGEDDNDPTASAQQTASTDATSPGGAPGPGAAPQAESDDRRSDAATAKPDSTQASPPAAQQQTEIAALDPRVSREARSAAQAAPATDAAAVGESPEQLPQQDTAPQTPRIPLAAGETPPTPSQRGRFRAKGRIALVIRGLGVKTDLTARTIDAMPAQVALGFVPYGKGLLEWTQRAKLGRHEVLIQIPLEPENYPETNPGPHTLLTSLSIDENLKRLDWLLDRFEGITGVSNYLGGKFAAAPGALAPVLMELKARDLSYVDDGKAANPTAHQLARQVSLSYAVADVVIDEPSRGPDAVARALTRVEAVARSEGKAIAIGHAHADTLAALKGWIAGLSEKGLVLEPIDQLLAVPPARQVSQTTDG